MPSFSPRHHSSSTAREGTAAAVACITLPFSSRGPRNAMVAHYEVDTLGFPAWQLLGANAAWARSNARACRSAKQRWHGRHSLTAWTTTVLVYLCLSRSAPDFGLIQIRREVPGTACKGSAHALQGKGTRVLAALIEKGSASTVLIPRPWSRSMFLLPFGGPFRAHSNPIHPWPCPVYFPRFLVLPFTPIPTFAPRY